MQQKLFFFLSYFHFSQKSLKLLSSFSFLVTYKTFQGWWKYNFVDLPRKILSYYQNKLLPITIDLINFK